MTIDKTFSIAVSGKGGVGKTNISALLIRKLSKNGSVMAIDADPDSNLAQALGVEVSKTIGDIRESVMDAAKDGTESQKGVQTFREGLYSLVEKTDRFDLVVMGRPEGEGCYCAINHVLRQVIDTRRKEYDFIVIDCEAGLEHLSRRTITNINLMILVTDPTYYGLTAARRICDISRDLIIKFDRTILVVNKTTEKTRDYLDEIVRENGLNVDAYIPYSFEITDMDVSGGSVFDLPMNCKAFRAVEELCSYILMPHPAKQLEGN
ncbi:MAG: AAA family ATPase [Thermodesulfobacteriota bacterium]|nr:AAA family ATPase [Thermodesulfobacteriota bacterium]